MRILKTITDKDEALLLGAYLLTAGIDCRVEESRSGKFEVWGLEEDKLEDANHKIEIFYQEEDRTKFSGALEQAKQITEKIRQEQERAARNFVDARERYSVLSGPAPVTVIFIVICVALWALEAINENYILLFQKWLFIAAPGTDFMENILSGQVWRLITPSFLHATLAGNGLMGVLHILFNMLWMKDLGPIIERREYSLKLVILILITAVVSNFAQYYMVDYRFVGASGVVYGLLGYLWMRSKYDRRYGIRLNSGVVWFMLVWLVFGFISAGPVANYGHLFGLLSGGVFGFLNAKYANRR